MQYLFFTHYNNLKPHYANYDYFCTPPHHIFIWLFDQLHLLGWISKRVNRYASAFLNMLLRFYSRSAILFFVNIVLICFFLEWYFQSDRSSTSDAIAEVKTKSHFILSSPYERNERKMYQNFLRTWIRRTWLAPRKRKAPFPMSEKLESRYFRKYQIEPYLSQKNKGRTHKLIQKSVYAVTHKTRSVWEWKKVFAESNLLVWKGCLALTTFKKFSHFY